MHTVTDSWYQYLENGEHHGKACVAISDYPLNKSKRDENKTSRLSHERKRHR